MVGRDVAARLHDGWAALDALQSCVDACGLAGFRLRDVYASEDGLDLRALDADATALRAAAARADEAADLVRAQGDRLTALWRGPAGQRAAQLVAGHTVAAGRLVSALRAAADSYGALGDELWGIVDGRVARTLDVAAGVRPGWAADERDAFVHNIILGEWTADMRRADDDVRAVYRRAVAALDAGGPIGFEVPGRLSAAPSPVPPSVPPVSSAPVAPVAPIAPVAAASPVPAPTSPWPPPQQLPPPIPLDTMGSGSVLPSVPPAAAPLNSLPASLPAMPDLGGPSAMPHHPDLPDLPGLSDTSGVPDKSDAPDAPDIPQGPEEPEDVEEPEGTDESGAPESGEPEPDEPTPADTEPSEPEPDPAPEAVAPEPNPSPESPATPCEIAADQLPQVGS